MMRSLPASLFCVLAKGIHGLDTTTACFSVAPMMAHTNRHFRSFIRTFSQNSVLYTEMVCADELTRTSTFEQLEKHLGFSSVLEEPLVLQLGGRNPKTLAYAVDLASSSNWGYRRFNLNCGCPSNAVATENSMGAAMLLEPLLTAECCAAMREADQSGHGGDNISVKCRIGVDDYDSYAFLQNFIHIVSTQGGVKRFQIHARKALLSCGTIDNRDIPPLRYDVVYQLVKDFPDIAFAINGGIASPEAVWDQLADDRYGLQGVMVGRAVVNHPYLFVHIDQLMREVQRSRQRLAQEPGLAQGPGLGERMLEVPSIPSRGEIIERYAAYCEKFEQYQLGSSGTGIGPNGDGDGSESIVHKPKIGQKQETQAMLAPAFNLFTGEDSCETFRRAMKKMSSKGVTSASAILRYAAKDLPKQALHGRVGETTSMDTAMEKYSRGFRKTNRPMKSRIL